jgi:hypothetical protein
MENTQTVQNEQPTQVEQPAVQAEQPVAQAEQPVAKEVADKEEERSVVDMHPDELIDAMNAERAITKKIDEVRAIDKVNTLEKAGVSKEQIETWKRQFGPVECQSILGQIYVYRGLSRLELNNINKMEGLTLEMKEEIFTEKCTLYPQLSRMNFSGNSAGVPTIIAEAIHALSGFVPEEETPVRL